MFTLPSAFSFWRYRLSVTLTTPQRTKTIWPSSLSSSTFYCANFSTVSTNNTRSTFYTYI